MKKKRDKAVMFAEIRQKVEANRKKKQKPETKQPFDKMLERIKLCEQLRNGKPLS